MNHSGNEKVWYVTREGKRFGPFTFYDLKLKVKRGELNPRLDMAWKDGMDDWIPTGKIEGLFEKNAEAEAAEIKREAPPVVTTQSKNAHGDAYLGTNAKEYTEGTSRRGYIFICYIFPVIVGAGLAFGMDFMEANLGEKLFPIVLLVLLVVVFVIIISATLDRFLNLGMSRWWFFGLLVPLLNSWLGYRLFACPAGYAEHKKLGGAGWVLAFVYWLPVFAMIGYGVLAGLKGPEAAQSMMQDGLTKMGVDVEKFQKKTPEEASE